MASIDLDKYGIKNTGGWIKIGEITLNRNHVIDLKGKVEMDAGGNVRYSKNKNPVPLTDATYSACIAGVKYYFSKDTCYFQYIERYLDDSWIPAYGYDLFEVHPSGRLRNKISGKERALGFSYGTYYWTVEYYENGELKSKQVNPAALMWHSFHIDQADKLYIHLIDESNPCNFALSNLCVYTPEDISLNPAEEVKLTKVLYNGHFCEVISPVIVRKDGSFKTARNNRYLGYLKKDGYRHVGLRIKTQNGKKDTVKFLAHILVYQAFSSNFDPKMIINHKNGNRGYNDARNLEMISHQDNIVHATKVLGKADTDMQAENANEYEIDDIVDMLISTPFSSLMAGISVLAPTKRSLAKNVLNKLAVGMSVANDM